MAIPEIKFQLLERAQELVRTQLADINEHEFSDKLRNKLLPEISIIEEMRKRVLSKGQEIKRISSLGGEVYDVKAQLYPFTKIEVRKEFDFVGQCYFTFYVKGENLFDVREEHA